MCSNQNTAWPGEIPPLLSQGTVCNNRPQATRSHIRERCTHTVVETKMHSAKNKQLHGTHIIHTSSCPLHCRLVIKTEPHRK